MIKNLVFEGGGVLGIAYGGALQELDNMGILTQVERVAGASAGAITAVLVALGYSGKEIAEIICKSDFAKFTNDSILGELDFVFTFGLHSGKNFTKWMEEQIVKKYGIKNLTFQQLKDISGTKDLYIIGTNLNYQIEEIYSYKTTPDMVISDAARISMSIPFYFDCIKKDCKRCNLQAKYDCSSKQKCVLVDGGVLWNYPVSIFDQDDISNEETLGFRLGRTDEKYYSSTRDYKYKKIKNIKDYSIVLIQLLLDCRSRIHIKDSDWKRTIFIDTGNISSLDFKLTTKEKEYLLDKGKTSVEEYFKKDTGISNGLD